MQAALASFSKKEGKKIAVLGQMNELGKHTENEHKQLVDWIKTSPLDDCYWVGSAFAPFVPTDRYFSNIDQAMDYFLKNLSGAIISARERISQFHTRKVSRRFFTNGACNSIYRIGSCFHRGRTTIGGKV